MGSCAYEISISGPLWGRVGKCAYEISEPLWGRYLFVNLKVNWEM